MTKILKKEGLVLSDQRIKVLANLGQIIRNLQETVPKNKDGEPLYYIEAQIILEYLTTEGLQAGDIPERVISDSMIEIDWQDGIPIVSGLPIWERLDCEPVIEYKLFKEYRDNIKTNDIAKRSFENIKEATGISVKALYAVSKVYHWRLRVNAFDKYRKWLVEDERKNLVKMMETNHRQAAETVFEKCIDYFGTLNEEQLKKITPKDMLGYFKEAVRLWRLSLGLPADKPATKEDRTKIEKIVAITDSKTININQGKEKEVHKNEYLQNLINILDAAKALPKGIEDNE